jgi:hypothetical protein
MHIYRLNSSSSGYLSGKRFCTNSNEHAVSIKTGKYLTRCAVINFHHGVSSTCFELSRNLSSHSGMTVANNDTCE